MAIELSNITFTEQDDIVPPSGVEPIFNTGIPNTLAGNDILTGTWTNISDGIIIPNPDFSFAGPFSFVVGFYNLGTLNTADGNDIITGIQNDPGEDTLNGYGIYNERGTIDTGDGNDIITGISQQDRRISSSSFGIDNRAGTINTGDGNDIITGISQFIGIMSQEGGIINTGDGNDTITGSALITGIYLGFTTDENLFGGSLDTGKGDDIITGTGFRGIDNLWSTFTTGDGDDTITGHGHASGIFTYKPMDTGDGNDIITGTSIKDEFGTSGFFNRSDLTTGDGNDIITGIGNIGISNGTGNNDIPEEGKINTGKGEDSIISLGKFSNFLNIFLGDGNDSITADTDFPSRAIENFSFIGTGDGNDIITSTGVIYNQGVMETGNGDDSIVVNGTGTGYGIYNNSGAINMGDGNDSIIANQGFESAENSSGAWFLGEGEDYIKGFGSGDFYGGNGNDTLELTSGTYTVGIWGEGGESPIFTKGDQLMITSEFEKLKAGSTIYDFTSLTAGQIIVVA